MRTILMILSFTFFALNTFAKSKAEKAPRKPSAQIALASNKLQIGDTARITWNNEFVTSVKNSPIKTKFGIITFDAEIPNTGSFTFVPTRDTTLRLVFETPDKTYKKNFEIKISYINISKFELSKYATTDEQDIEITWNVTNANRVSITGIGDSLATSGKTIYRPDSTTKISIVAYNRNQRSMSRDKELVVRNIDHYKSPQKPFRNDSVWVRWHYKLAKSVNINGSTFNAHDSVCYRACNDTVFNIAVYRTNGTTSYFVDTPKVQNAYIQHFMGPMESNQGTQSMLTWCAPGCSYVTIDNGARLPIVGFVMAKPQKTTTFTLKAYVNNRMIGSLTHTITIIDRRAFADSIRDISLVPKNTRIDFDIITTDKSNFPKEVKIRVIAIDEQGFLITGLANKKISGNYFKSITEKINKKDVPVKITSIKEVSDKSKCYNIGLALDNSGSMYKSISTLEKAFKRFVNAKQKNDNINFVKFDDRIYGTPKNLTSRDSIIKMFNSKSYSDMGGATALYAGASIALKNINDSVKNEKVLIIFTDGYENASFMYNDSCATNAWGLIHQALSKNVRIITIGYGEGINDFVLYWVARITGGNYYHIKSQSDIESVFREIPRLNKNYYEITYKPTDTNEGNREISMKTNNNKNVTVVNTGHYFVGDNFTLSEFKNDPKMSKIDSLVQNLLTDKPMSFTDTIKSTDTTKPVPVVTTVPQTTPSIICSPQRVASFAYDKFNLDTTGLANSMKPYISFLAKHTHSGLVILGHTDTRGSSDACLTLSKRRAEEIQDYLILKGISPNRIRVLALGKTQPLWTPDRQKWQAAENRRVEVLIVK